MNILKSQNISLINLNSSNVRSFYSFSEPDSKEKFLNFQSAQHIKKVSRCNIKKALEKGTPVQDMFSQFNCSPRYLFNIIKLFNLEYLLSEHDLEFRNMTLNILDIKKESFLDILKIFKYDILKTARFYGCSEDRIKNCIKKFDIKLQKEKLSKEVIEKALIQSEGYVKGAASMLDISVSALSSKMQYLGIKRPVKFTEEYFRELVEKCHSKEEMAETLKISVSLLNYYLRKWNIKFQPKVG